MFGPQFYLIIKCVSVFLSRSFSGRIRYVLCNFMVLAHFSLRYSFQQMYTRDGATQIQSDTHTHKRKCNCHVHIPRRNSWHFFYAMSNLTTYPTTKYARIHIRYLKVMLRDVSFWSKTTKSLFMQMHICNGFIFEVNALQFPYNKNGRRIFKCFMILMCRYVCSAVVVVSGEVHFFFRYVGTCVSSLRSFSSF